MNYGTTKTDVHENAIQMNFSMHLYNNYMRLILEIKASHLPSLTFRNGFSNIDLPSAVTSISCEIEVFNEDDS